MKKIRMRLGFDIALGLMLVFEMLYTLTGNVLHELVGVVFFATMVAHLVFARKWSGSMVRSLKERQKLPGEQKARLAIAIALAVCAIAVAASSVAISNLLGPSPEYLLSGAYTAWCLVHTVSAYGMCALAVVHLLLHWVFVAKVLKISYNPERRQAINTAMGAIAGVAAVAIGASGLQAVASFADVPVSGQVGDGASDGRNGSGRNRGGAPDADGDLPADGSNGHGGAGDDGKLPADGNKGDGAPFGSEGSEEAAPSQRDQRRKRRRGTEEGSGSNGGDGGNVPDDGSTSGPDGSNGRQPNSGNGSGSNGGNGVAPDSGNGSGSSGGNGNSTSDICTLCRKYCPLSAPRCNKPYAAGLI